MIYFSQTSKETGFWVWIQNNVSLLLHIVIILLVALLARRIVSKILSQVLRKAMRPEMYPSKTDRDRRLRTLTSISNAIIGFIIWAIALLMILSDIGVNTAPILASAGILSVALGFGAQSLVRDFMTGMFIIAENQYRVGDYVEIQNVKGIVKSISMRTTVIKDDDGTIYHVPNGSIVVTTNRTMNNDKISMELSVAHDTNLEALRKAIDDTGKKQTQLTEQGDIITEPLHFDRIVDMKGGAIIVRITGRTKVGQQMHAQSAFYEALQKEFTKRKIVLK